MERILLVILVGTGGGVLAQRMHFPGGALVGAMLGSAVAAVVLPGKFEIPGHIGTLIQIVLGITLGMSFDRSSLDLFTRIIPLATVSTFVLLVITVLMAYMAHRFGILDSATALYGLSPGGMSGMSLMAQHEGYRTDVVAMLHTFRIFLLFLFVPLLGRIVSKLFT